MALKFSLDLEGATFDELATFVESLKTAGMKDHDTLTLDGTQLVATVEPTGGQAGDNTPGPASSPKLDSPHAPLRSRRPSSSFTPTTAPLRGAIAVRSPSHLPLA